MVRSGKHQYHQRPRPPTSLRNENDGFFPLIHPSCQVLNRYMPEKWEAWELSYVREWFEIEPRPGISLRKGWAMQLAEARVFQQRNGLLNRDIQTRITRQEFNETLTQWHDQYERRLTNWFENTQTSVKWGRTPLTGDLFDAPFSRATTPTGANQLRNAADNLYNTDTPTLTTYSSASAFPVNYKEDDENTPTPKPSYHRVDSATPVASLPAQPETSTKSTLDDLATLAAEALQRRQHNPYPEYPESAIYGAHLLLNLKG